MSERVDPSSFLELGRSGSATRWGDLSEWCPELRGQRGARIYRQMADEDPIVGACLRAIRLLCGQASWRVVPASTSPEDERRAAFLSEGLDDMSHDWRGVVDDALTCLVYGWSFLEIVYKRRLGFRGDPPSKHSDGKIGWKKMALRNQTTLAEWVIDDEGGVRGMVQVAPPRYARVTIPIEKALLFRLDRSSPEGKSILRNAYRPWFLKRRLEIVEAIGAERDLAGLPVVWVPESVLRGDTPEDVAARDRFLELVSSIRRDQREGVVMPLSYDDRGQKRYDIQLLSTGGRRQMDVGDIIQRYDTRIAQSMLSDFILLGTQRVGTYSLGEVKLRAFSLAVESVLDEIQGVFNAHAVPRLFALNGEPTDSLPRLEHGPVREVDVGALAELIERLSRAGASIFPDEELENRVLALAGLARDERP